ncbi:hypothetical protein, partial [Staphylococcus aureus]
LKLEALRSAAGFNDQFTARVALRGRKENSNRDVGADRSTTAARYQHHRIVNVVPVMHTLFVSIEQHRHCNAGSYCRLQQGIAAQ